MAPLLKVPAAQVLAQAVAPGGEKEPKEQELQLSAPATAEYVFAAQLGQTLAPAVEYDPAAQAMHAVDVTPIVEENRPATHGVHALEPVLAW